MRSGPATAQALQIVKSNPRLRVQQLARRTQRRHLLRASRRVAVLLTLDLTLLVALKTVSENIVTWPGGTMLVEFLPNTLLGGWATVTALLIGQVAAGAYGSREAWAAPGIVVRGVVIGMSLTMWQSISTAGIVWTGIRFVTSVVAIGFVMAVARWLLSLIVIRYRVAVRPGDKVILVGDPKSPSGSKALSLVTHRPEMRCVGWLSERGDIHDYLGHPSAVWEVLCDTGIDTVLLCGDLEPGLFGPVVEAAAVAGCRVLSMPTHRTLTATQPRAFRDANLPLLELTFPAGRAGQNVLKRILDVVAATLLLVLLSPLLLLAALWIRADSDGPVFFIQDRVGQAGRVFPMFKFRTMSDGADGSKDDLMHLNESGDPRLFKIPNDPRVTRAGEFLRRWSIDEVPQLFNVIRGTMSLVGPRPFFASDLRDYDDHHFVRLTVKPGMTGLWQVRGRSSIVDFEEVVELDREYIQNWSLLLDLRILLGTLPAVLRRTGAF